MVSVQLSNIERKMRYFIQHYNPRKYWKYRKDVPENATVFAPEPTLVLR